MNHAKTVFDHMQQGLTGPEAVEVWNMIRPGDTWKLNPGKPIILTCRIAPYDLVVFKGDSTMYYVRTGEKKVGMWYAQVNGDDAPGEFDTMGGAKLAAFEQASKMVHAARFIIDDILIRMR